MGNPSPSDLALTATPASDIAQNPYAVTPSLLERPPSSPAALQAVAPSTSPVGLASSVSTPDAFAVASSAITAIDTTYTSTSDRITAGPDTTQLSSSSIAAITAPLVLVAAGLLVLTFITFANRRRARKRKGSRSGLDLFDKDPADQESQKWQDSSESRWYALGLGLADARAGHAYPTDRIKAARTPHWFAEQGRWMTSIGGGNLSSVSNEQGYERDVESEKAITSNLDDPTRPHSRCDRDQQHGVTVTVHQTGSATRTATSTESSAPSSYDVFTGQIAKSVAQAAMAASVDSATPYHPKSLLSRHLEASSDSGGVCRSPMQSTVRGRQSCRGQDLALTRKSSTAVGGLPLDRASDVDCHCPLHRGSAAPGDDRYLAMNRGNESYAVLGWPTAHSRLSLFHYGQECERDVDKESVTSSRDDPMSRIRHWRDRTSSQDVRSFASPSLGPLTERIPDPHHPTPLLSEPPPTLSPLSTVYADEDHFDRESSDPKSSARVGDACRVRDSASVSQKSFTSYTSAPTVPTKQRPIARNEGDTRYSRSFPVSAPRSPSMATESLHPRRDALRGSRPASTVLSCASTTTAERMRIYAPSTSVVSGSFVTAHSDPSHVGRCSVSSDELSSSYQQPAPRPAPFASTDSSEIMLGKGRLDSTSTVKPDRILPISAVPSRLSRDSSAARGCKERADSAALAWGATPLRRSGTPHRTRRSHSLASQGTLNSSADSVHPANGWTGRLVRRERTRNGEAWERSVLSGGAS